MLNSGIRLMLAPMAGYSDQPFRRLCKLFGADEVITELISSNAIVRGNKRTFRMTELHEDEKPASVQIFGSDPDVMAEAARRVATSGCSFIDINMGCPAKKVVRNCAGSALLNDPDLAGRIVKKVVEAVEIPVSVKIRTGKNSKNKTGFDVALQAAQNGASRITIHARTVADMFTGPIDYEFVAKVRKHLPSTVELIGNGGIESLEDAKRWIELTCVDGLMIGRGAVGHPSIFRSIKNGEAHPPIEKLDTVIRHCEWMIEYYGPKYAIGPIRGHLMNYSKGFVSARKFRIEVGKIDSFEELKKTIELFFTKELESAA